VNPLYALAARRHMTAYGTTEDQLGAIAVAQRAWAVDNPLAQLRTPMTLADHHASRWVAEPLRLFDCCLVSNGAVAVIVTSDERATALAQPPVRIAGLAQDHPGRSLVRNDDFGLRTGAAISGPRALAMAGVTLDDVDVVQLYDCYTYTVLVSLEDYGFCAKGEGGPFVASGALGPAGSLRLNTGGGQLSGYYMWGFTPLSEAVIQVRGQGGERQADRHDVCLVSGNGGILDHHATMVLTT
jgi:acetyl-CoA acetyltransferase